jgi:GTP cyclohydrolase I
MLERQMRWYFRGVWVVMTAQQNCSSTNKTAEHGRHTVEQQRGMRCIFDEEVKIQDTFHRTVLQPAVPE